MGTTQKTTNMGISRDSRHKRRLTGGRMPIHQKKRKFESGKPAANTKLAEKRIRLVRSRGGNTKLRALRLNKGNFMWQSEGITKKCKIVNVVYNPVSNELVRTNTLTKNTIVYIDGNPFSEYVHGHYFAKYGVTKENKKAADVAKLRRINHHIEKSLQEQLNKGSCLAKITSRPGQSGRADGCILEGKELEFYLKKLPKKK